MEQKFYRSGFVDLQQIQLLNILRVRLPAAIFYTSFWRSYRGGHTRSHPEHGS
jgi:hypothetical protein